MKICAIICEFNPFHNGHAYLLERARAAKDFDALLCVMSGPFTQRGDMALTDKFTRAGHAVMGGADAVVELPSPFAVAPAPAFADGAVKLLASVPEVCAIAFGCESEGDFYGAARAVADNRELFDMTVKAGLERGESYAKSCSDGVEAVCGGAVAGPNDLLALEYASAVLRRRPELELLPVKRMGAEHGGRELGRHYASASAIRANLGDGRARACVPPYAADGLQTNEGSEGRMEAIIRYALMRGTAASLEGVYGGGEGLANKLKALSGLRLEEIISAATSRRYPSSRIRRALTANALGFAAEDTERFLRSAGYLKPLAVKRERADEMLAALARSPLPVVITGSDVMRLEGATAELYAASRLAHDVWCAASGRQVYDCTLKKI